jgi:hypothetical protein
VPPAPRQAPAEPVPPPARTPGAEATPTEYTPPRPRRAGTTYGGTDAPGAGEMTMALPGGDPLENSGSLTGHILAQGRADAAQPESNTAKVVLVGILLLVTLIVIGLVAAIVAGDTVNNLFGGSTNG